MDAIILAGGKADQDDPLYTMTKGGYKSMLEIAGKPMVQWVLDALSGVDRIGHVVVIGLNSENTLRCTHPTIFLPDHGGIIQNIKAGAEALLEINPDPDARMLAISADVPSITPEVIEWTMDAVAKSDHDLYYCVVERDVMDARFPDSKRSFVPIKHHLVCGGDLNAVRVGEAARDHELVDMITASRKNVFKQASLIGFDTLFLLLIRQLSIAAAEKRIGKRLKFRGKVIINPYAEVAMDVDKPFQFEIMEKELIKRK